MLYLPDTHKRSLFEVFFFPTIKIHDSVIMLHFILLSVFRAPHTYGQKVIVRICNLYTWATDLSTPAHQTLFGNIFGNKSRVSIAEKS